MAYLLDTNILSQAVRQPGGQVAKRIKEIGDLSIYTSVIVAAEMRYGVALRGSPKLSRQVEAVLSEIRIEAFTPPMDSVYAEVRSALEKAGTPIGANDLWIAAQALHDEATLVTDNMREFGRVSGLKLENWLTD